MFKVCMMLIICLAFVVSILAVPASLRNTPRDLKPKSDDLDTTELINGLARNYGNGNPTSSGRTPKNFDDIRAMQLCKEKVAKYSEKDRANKLPICILEQFLQSRKDSNA